MHAHQLLGLAQSADARVLRALVRRTILAQCVQILAGVLRRSVRLQAAGHLRKEAARRVGGDGGRGLLLWHKVVVAIV